VRYIAIWALIVLPLLAEALVVAVPFLRVAPVATSPKLAHHLLRWLASATSVSRRMDVMEALVGRGIWTTLAILVVLLTVARGGVLPGASSRTLNASYDAQVFPVQAVERLRSNGLPAGVGFNTYTWGGYLDYALPAHRAFIDSRSDEYSEALLADYLTITRLAPGWQQALDHYTVAWALLPRAEPLAQALALLPTWQCAPADDQDVAVLCARADRAAAAWVPAPSRAGAERGSSPWPS
jgi:hypothetical protein